MFTFMAQLWEIVGGSDKGGILVREGHATSSTQCADRLSTGALVEEVELRGDRLHYMLVDGKGSGPTEGWISIKLKDKELAKRSDEKLPEPEIGSDGPKRKTPPWKKVTKPEIAYGDIKAVAEQNQPGDYYRMNFPHSKDQIVEYGPEWMTRAFHRSGVLPRSNAVTAIKDAKEFVGGGAGLKCTFEVEYKEDAPYLHKKLFAKLPHKPGGSDRYYVSVMWDHDRPEIVFNIFMSDCVPFRVPKYYWGDICAGTTNFILITESIPWSPKGKKEFVPGEIEPAYDKYKDWELPDGGPMYYLAACKALGKMAGAHKTGKLHPQTNDMFPMPDPVKEIPILPKKPDGWDTMTRKEMNAKSDQLINFVCKTAAAVMPPEIRDKEFLEEWKEDMLLCAMYGAEMVAFMMGAETPSPNDYVVLTHNNLQIDNAFFWRNEDNKVEIGLLDWGVLNCAPAMAAISGCISGASEDVLCEHKDAFIQAFCDSYEEHGGPKLDFERMKQMYWLSVIQWSSSVIGNVTQVLKHTKAKEWAEVTDWMDPKLVDRFQTRAHTTQFKETLVLWKRWELYERFKEWKKACGLPSKS